ncbi:MAG: hypothetical protein ABIE68_02095 [bacterium]
MRSLHSITLEIDDDSIEATNHDSIEAANRKLDSMISGISRHITSYVTAGVSSSLSDGETIMASCVGMITEEEANILRRNNVDVCKDE